MKDLREVINSEIGKIMEVEREQKMKGQKSRPESNLTTYIYERENKTKVRS